MAVYKEKLKAMFQRADFYGASTEGGMGSMHLGLLKGFISLGHEPFFVSCGRIKLPPGVKYYFVPYNNLFRNFPEVLNMAYNGRVVQKVKKIIEKEQPDFIYQHHADFIYAGSKLKRDLGIPFFMQAEGVQQWVKKHWGKLYFEKPHRIAEQLQWEMADAIFVISEAVKQMMIEYGAEGSKIHVHPSGVDPDVFHPGVDGSEIRKKLNIGKKFVCGFTGTFAQWHGVDVLAESVKHIVARIPEAIVLFVGDGMLRPQIEEILKRDNMEKHAIITGVVPYPKVPEYLAACDVLLSPCVSNEEGLGFFNSPVKLFEYLAMQRPIVASDVGQQAEVIEDGVNGLLCEERSPEDLAEKIFSLYKNKDLAEETALQARRSAVEKYNWNSNAQGVVDVYRKLKE